MLAIESAVPAGPFGIVVPARRPDRVSSLRGEGTPVEGSLDPGVSVERLRPVTNRVHPFDLSSIGLIGPTQLVLFNLPLGFLEEAPVKTKGITSHLNVDPSGASSQTSQTLQRILGESASSILGRFVSIEMGSKDAKQVKNIFQTHSAPQLYGSRTTQARQRKLNSSKRAMWALRLLMVALTASQTLNRVNAQGGSARNLCFDGGYMSASSNSSAFCSACVALAGDPSTDYSMAGDFTSGTFTCNNVLGTWGGLECSSNPYEPKTCTQAASLKVLEPTCTSGGSMDTCAYNLTFAMMTAGESEDYVYLGRWNLSCPAVQGYTTDPRNEANYWLSGSPDEVYSMKNADGKLKLAYKDCEADVTVLYGSFLGVQSGGHGDDSGVGDWGRTGLSVPVFFVMSALGYGQLL